MARRRRNRVVVRTIGMEELQKAIEEKRDQMYEALEKSTEEAAELIRQKAESKAPVLSGDLKMSIKAELNFADPVSGKVSYNISADADDEKGAARASFTELGTAHSKAEPFLRPAIRSNKKKIRELFTANVRQEIDS